MTPTRSISPCMKAENRVSRILGVRYPVILGPMRLITLGAMAGAVSAAGGLGVIAASGLSKERLVEEIQGAQAMTQNPIGINIPVYRPNALEALEIAIGMGITTIYTSAGDPKPFMDRIRKAGLTVIHKVSSEKTALKAQEAGVDAVVAMGFEAGGHVGRGHVTTFCLIPRLSDILSIPVIAAGGIADARGVVAALALGAEGVEIGTRFVATTECPVPGFFKTAICDADLESTLLLGKEAMPIRVLKNRATMRVAGMESGQADAAMENEGDMAYVQSGGNDQTAVMPCGQIAGLVMETQTISQVMAAIRQTIEPVVERIRRVFPGEPHPSISPKETSGPWK